MAIEDGMILARCLEISADTAEALQRYEVACLERTSRIVDGSYDRIVRIGSELADPDQAQAFMDCQFASASGATYDWIHRYDAMSAPL
jgi:salicylate hydroxylase